MSIRMYTPCDDGPCPYGAGNWSNCEYWCGAEEPDDQPEEPDDQPEEGENDDQ